STALPGCGRGTVCPVLAPALTVTRLGPFNGESTHSATPPSGVARPLWAPNGGLAGSCPPSTETPCQPPVLVCSSSTGPPEVVCPPDRVSGKSPTWPVAHTSPAFPVCE